MISQDNAHVAADMVKIFLDNSDDNYNLNETGFSEISDLFKTVVEDERATVYMQFISILDDLNIKYDTKQFGAS